MKIEHVAVYVNDLEAAKDFFVKYFKAQVGKFYLNHSTDFCSYFLSFEDGARLELMIRPRLLSDIEELHIGYAHIAFSVGNKANVDELTQNIVADGYKLLSGPRKTGDGYYESCIAGPSGIAIEITE